MCRDITVRFVLSRRDSCFIVTTAPSLVLFYCFAVYKKERYAFLFLLDRFDRILQIINKKKYILKKVSVWLRSSRALPTHGSHANSLVQRLLRFILRRSERITISQ